MAITDNGTASAVNVVLSFLLPSAREKWRPEIEVEEAIAAAEQLARASHKQLGAGLSASSIRQASAIDAARLQAILRG